MAAIIGAFFSGLMFADYAPRWNLLPRVSGITEFLAPFFSFSIGSRLNVHLFTGDVLFTAIVISVLNCVEGDWLWAATMARRLAQCVAGRRRYDAAWRSGFDCGAGRVAIAGCAAVYICHRGVHDCGDYDFSSALVEKLVSWRDGGCQGFR
jgi:hypothetical protein